MFDGIALARVASYLRATPQSVDAVFERHGEGVRTHEAPPAKTDVADVAQRVHDRSLVWLRRHRYLDERPAEDRSNEPAADTPIDALARLALGGGTFVSRPFAPDERARDEDLDRREPRFSATYNGFDVHCAVRVEAGDDLRRERLVRYHGVFGARSSWRALVTPKPRDGVARRMHKPKTCSDDRQAGAPEAAPTPVPVSVPVRSTPQAGPNDAAKDAAKAPPQAGAAATTAAATTAAVMAAPSATPGASGLHAVAVPSDDPTMITVEHWSRLLDGELYAASSRVEWALLLRRTYGVDALRCHDCAGRMRVVATIVEPGTVKKILTHLGLPTEPLPRARARDPTGQESFDFDAA